MGSLQLQNNAERICSQVIPGVVSSEATVIYLQQFGTDKGYTDIELIDLGEFHIIVEAKRGWSLPDVSQLNRYEPRFNEIGANVQVFLVLSECSAIYVKNNLPAIIQNACIVSLRWREIVDIAQSIRHDAPNKEKHLLNELTAYLRGVTTMQNKDSNWVFIVALSTDIAPGSTISWKDIVEKKGYYFHPYAGNGWPKEPPNYVAFRHGGKLLSIHHIEHYEIVTDMHDHIPEIGPGTWDPHYLYTLGPGFSPSHEVKNGKLYPNGRYWCMLDTLFTCNTISEARDLSKDRVSK